jgi:hypothetical protein
LRLLVLAIGTIFRPKALLIAENLCLRQQLVVVQRRHLRPRLSDADRRFWILPSRWFSDWRNPLLIVKPETVLGWQRAGWMAYWRWRSSRRARGGPPAIRGEPQASESRLWGQKRIQAEFARLGFQVSAYVTYYNRWRPHRSLGQAAPCGAAMSLRQQACRKIAATTALGGLHRFTGLQHDKFLHLQAVLTNRKRR